MNLWTLHGVKSWAVAAVGVTMLAVATPTLAQEENPWKQGNYWDVSSIHVKDGSGLKYAQFLAGNWVKNQEFAKSQGWISSYMVLSNEYPREGEPDLYLITVFASMASPDEADKRAQAWREFNKKTMTQMQAESGARADYRTVGSQLLLREMVLRNCPITPTKNAGQPHRIGASGSGLPSRSIRSNSHASRPGVRQYFEKLDVCICLCLLSSNAKRPDDPHCRSTNRKRSCSTPSAGP